MRYHSHVFWNMRFRRILFFENLPRLLMAKPCSQFLGFMNKSIRKCVFNNRTNIVIFFQETCLLSSTVGQKRKNIVVTHPSTPYFLLPFFKTFVIHPPKINDLDTVVPPPKKKWNVHLLVESSTRLTEK